MTNGSPDGMPTSTPPDDAASGGARPPPSPPVPRPRGFLPFSPGPFLSSPYPPPSPYSRACH